MVSNFIKYSYSENEFVQTTIKTLESFRCFVIVTANSSLIRA
jgi:hypothetical protein